MRDELSPKLIFDIGVSDGVDTEFYLAKGFDVVGVEADAVLCASLRVRFRESLKSGRLILINKAAAEWPNEMISFYRNPKVPQVSSVQASRRTNESVVCTVETVTWSDLTAIGGVPYYAKIDIEGGETAFLKSIPSSGVLPTYVSVECSTPEPIHLLSKLGYKYFRLMNQTLVNRFAPPNPAREGVYLPNPKVSHWSGLFGRELPGEKWFRFSEIIEIYRQLHALWAHKTLLNGWLDVHACLDVE